MFAFRLEDPVQVSGAVGDEVGEVGFQQHVDGETLAGFFDEGDAHAAHDLAARTIGTKKETGLDLVYMVGKGIAHSRDDGVGGRTRKGNETRIEAECPSVENGAARKDGFELGLGKINMVAGRSGIIIALFEEILEREFNKK